MSNVLECVNLNKRYGKTGVEALKNVNLNLPSGKIVGLLGPNGSGKTTLIKTACGLLTPTSGEIKVCGLSPGPESKALVSYLPERDYLPTWMRINDLIEYFGDFYSRDFQKEKAYEMLARLNINPKDKMKTMSKGTREKVQLVLVMSRKAELYILDEPIGGVDPAARDYILDTIIGNYSEDATVLLSTHLIGDIERVLDSVVFINGGEISLVSSVDDIRENNNMSVDSLFRETYKI